MKAALFALGLVAASAAHGQDFRMSLGYLELTHPYGLLVGLPLGRGLFNLEGQVGPGGAGGTLGMSWGFRLRDPDDQDIKWFVNAGLGRYFTSANPGTPVGGVLTFMGGLRYVPNSGLTLEAGLGVYQDVDRIVTGESKRGTAGRLAIGWQF